MGRTVDTVLERSGLVGVCERKKKKKKTCSSVCFPRKRTLKYCPTDKTEFVDNNNN